MAATCFPEDLVRLRGADGRTGGVAAVHEAAELSIPHRPWLAGQSLERHTSVSHEKYMSLLMTGVPPLGTIVVEWDQTGSYEIIALSEVDILERSLFAGDIVKRHTDDAMSGVVITTNSFCSLQPTQTYELADGQTLYGFRHPFESPDDSVKLSGSPELIHDVPFSDLELADPFFVDSMVVYGDWLGSVRSITRAHTLLLLNKTVVEITEFGGTDLQFDDIQVGDLLQTKKGVLRKGRWILGQYNPSIQPIATLVATRVIDIDVQWLHSRPGSSAQPPDENVDRIMLESNRFCIYDRSKHPTIGHDKPDVTFTEPELMIDARVRFRDLAMATLRYSNLSRIPRTATSGYDLTLFNILQTRKQVRVIWQDLSITEHDSKDLIPDLSLEDEHSAWPGEIAINHDLKPLLGLPGCYFPSKVGVIQSVRSQERLATVRWCPQARVHYSIEEEKLGVPKAGANKTLVQAVIGATSGEAEELSVYDIDTPGVLNVRRGDIVLINEQAQLRLQGKGGCAWLGEIVQDNLNGTLLVRLGAASTVQDMAFTREEVTVAIRSEDMNADDNDADEDMLDVDSDDISASDSESEDGSVLSLNMRGNTYEDEHGMPLAESDVEADDWESTSEMEDEVAKIDTAESNHGQLAMDVDMSPSESSEQYTLLDQSVPSDHHFATHEAPLGTSLKRVQKEHKILQRAEALPVGVFVRSWESRLDLLRVLIIGPQDTPYANAPFVVDFWLPSAFPTAPPHAYFHSWPGDASLGGSGRVNPNLYEDGTICLSLLGTWSGEQQENWNAGTSTLLQVIVSLLGLVLVREPYYNEAGYEHLAGTDTAKRASMLYSEKATLRALNFTIAAVSAVQQERKLAGLSGFEHVLQEAYLAHKGSMLLTRVCEHTRAILKRSEEATQPPDGIVTLSQGACIPLRRVLARLDSMLASAC